MKVQQIRRKPKWKNEKTPSMIRQWATPHKGCPYFLFQATQNEAMQINRLHGLKIYVRKTQVMILCDQGANLR